MYEYCTDSIVVVMVKFADDHFQISAFPFPISVSVFHFSFPFPFSVSSVSTCPSETTTQAIGLPVV